MLEKLKALFKSATGDGYFDTSSTWSMIGRQGAPSRRTQDRLLEAYSTHSALHSFISTIAQSVATTPWRAYRMEDVDDPVHKSTEAQKRVQWRLNRSIAKSRVKQITGGYQLSSLAYQKRIAGFVDRGQLTEIVAHPILDLLESPSSLFSSGEEFFEVLQSQLDLAGESFIWLWNSREGDVPEGTPPEELLVIPPTWIREVPEPNKPYFVVQMGNSTEHRQIPAHRLVWAKCPNPADPYGRGVGVAHALADELDADEYAGRTAVRRLFNHGIPASLVSIQGVRKEELQAFERDFRSKNQGWLNAGRTHFTNAQIEVQQLEDSLASMGLRELRRDSRDIQRETFKLPPELVGDSKDANRATIQAAEQIGSTYVMMPRLMKLANIFNRHVAPLLDRRGNVIVLPDSPVPEDTQTALATSEIAPWSRSVNEWRELQGLPPKSGRVGSMHFIPEGFKLKELDDEFVAAQEEAEEAARQRLNEPEEEEEDEADEEDKPPKDDEEEEENE